MTDTLDRREFLTRSALGAAALAMPRRRRAAVRRRARRSGMFVSLPPWAVARNVGWPEQARLAARVGYKGIDWAFGPAKAAGVEATRALLAELAIVPTIVNLPMQDTLGADDAAFEAQLPDARRGCGVLPRDRVQSLPARARPHDARTGSRRRSGGRTCSDACRRWPRCSRSTTCGWGSSSSGRSCSARAARRDAAARAVRLDAARDARALRGVGANVGVTLDAWHWYHSGGTVADIRAADASRIVHVHVSDARAMPPEEVRDDMRLLPGEGVIDLVGFFQALKAIGYRGGVAPETIGPRIPDGMPPEESARLALEATLAVMRKAGVA